MIPAVGYVYLRKRQVDDEKNRRLLEEEGRRSWSNNSSGNTKDLSVVVGRSGGGVWSFYSTPIHSAFIGFTFYVRGGISPFPRYLKKHFGCAAVSTVQNHLLEVHGHVSWRTWGMAAEELSTPNVEIAVGQSPNQSFTPRLDYQRLKLLLYCCSYWELLHRVNVIKWISST